MSTAKDTNRREVLLLTLLALFVGFFVTAEILGAKLWKFTLFGVTPQSIGLSDDTFFVATAGIFAFPLTFILTDIINEYFGRRIVRVFTWLAIAVNVILQPIVIGATRAPTVVFGQSYSDETAHQAYVIAFGQTPSIVAASLVAFGVAQFVDAWVFTWLRKKTGGKMLWLRSQGSTVVSQLIDTGIVIFVAFVVIPEVLGQEHMTVDRAAVISLTNYVYKFAIAIVITPLLYLVHAVVKAWLGHAEAAALAAAAHPTDPV
ncbi:MAG: queuosine precursor transporter [Planctomycetota bacterium]|nr:queuosine precursor transporter [Planctomycetota bacterium]